MPGGEHERALVRSRVRQRKVRVVAALAGHADDVEVERARPPPHQADAREGRLHLVQPVEEFARRDRDVGEHDGVQVVRLRRAADRHRLIDRRHARQLDPLDSRDRVDTTLEDVAPVSEVTAQCEDHLTCRMRTRWQNLPLYRARIRRPWLRGTPPGHARAAAR